MRQSENYQRNPATGVTISGAIWIVLDAFLCPHTKGTNLFVESEQKVAGTMHIGTYT